MFDENNNALFGSATGNRLEPIDIQTMCELNADLLAIVEDSTVKKIIKEYEKFKKKLDIFHVAFSGGKDSAVLLDLVKKALPIGSFVVIFGDTGMEFPDTYKAVEITKQQCENDETPFYIAKSHFEPQDSWKLFGPPARVLRWCCSVHKSTPQTLKMREITGKNDYLGMDFVGVRSHESIARSKYDYENFGKKQKGQYSYNPILEWTSAEVWLYIFANDIYINEAYKKGNSRAGCMFCPMSGGASDYFRHTSYKNEVNMYVDYIKDSYTSKNAAKANSYLTNGGWNARNNGRDLADNPFRCFETVQNGLLKITTVAPTSDWLEWMKTIGDVSYVDNSYSVRFENQDIRFSVTNSSNGYIVTISDSIIKEIPKFIKLFRQVFRKASYCVGCQVCETNCKNGCIKFTNGKLTITNCTHCHQCHLIDC